MLRRIRDSMFSSSHGFVEHRMNAMRRKSQTLLFAPLLAFFEGAETGVAPASTNERANERVFADLVECVLVGFNGPLRSVQLGPVYLVLVLIDCKHKSTPTRLTYRVP